MAVLLQLSATARNNMLDGITSAVGSGGILRIYDGTGGRPANVAAGIGTNVLLSEATCGTPFAGAASLGVLTLTVPITDTAANATGTAVWFRIWKSDGTTAVLDGNVGTATADLIMSTTSFVTNAVITISAFTITAGNS
jgi:hypothetical protein